MSEKNAEQKQVLRLYAALGAALVLSLVPMLSAAALSALLFLGALIVTYIARSKSEEGSLLDNHATFLIRTIWITGLVALISLLAGCFYLVGILDSRPLQPCADRLLSMGEQAQTMAMLELMPVLEPCIDGFLAANQKPLLIAGAIVVAPVLIYLVSRFTRGLARAMKGYRMANVKSWL